MEHRTMIKIGKNKESFSVRTVSRTFRSPHTFYILINDLERLEQQGRVIIRDIRSFAELRLIEESGQKIVEIVFTWLHDADGTTLTGRSESVRLPYYCFRETSSTELRILSITKQSKPKIEFQSTRNLHQVIEVPLLRSKLARFLNSHFCWIDYQRIVLFDDFIPYSFMFNGYTERGQGICGGVILHGQENMTTAYYGMHT